jgi:hypothetical protein
MGIEAGDSLQVQLNGTTNLATAELDEGVPAGVVLVPRSLGIAICQPQAVQIRTVEKSAA